MFRIRFPVRVEKAENNVRRIQESPGEIENLLEIQEQEIEILYAVSVGEVAASSVPLISMPPPMTSPRRRQVAMDITLNLDENIIDWFEERLEEGQPLDEAINKALMDHIRWVSSHSGAQRKDKPVRQAGNPA